MLISNPARPKALSAPQGGFIPDSFRDNSFRGDNGGGSNLIYIGWAAPGTAEGALGWQIRFLAYDGNGNVTSITWPVINGAASKDFLFSWTSRASYTYV